MQTWAKSTQTTLRTHISSHAAGMVVVKIAEDGEVEFLLIDYTIRGQTTKRCLMGKQDSKTDSPIDTLRREMQEEAIANQSSDFECEFVGRSPIILTELVYDHEDARGWHLKMFHLVNLVRGELRTDILVERDGIEEEILGPPTWYDASEALEMVSLEGASKPVHMRALKAALLMLVSMYPKVAEKYSQTADIYCNGVDRRPLKPIVIDYLKRFV